MLVSCEHLIYIATADLAESILYHALTAECDYADAVLAFFKQAKHHLGLSYPSVSCPGDPGNYVDELLEHDRRESALAKVEADLVHAEKAGVRPGQGDGLLGQGVRPRLPRAERRHELARGGSAFWQRGREGAGITTGAVGGRQVIPARP